MQDVTGELLRNVFAPTVPSTAGCVWTNTGAGAVNILSLLESEKSYFLISTEDCWVTPEVDAVAANAAVNDFFVPAGIYVPFSPYTGLLGLSVIRDAVNGKLGVLRARNIRVG